MNPGHHDKVRQLAHQIWEDEGRPEGRADEHWARAEDMVKAARTVKAVKPKAPTKPKAPAKPKAAAKAK